MKEYDGRVRVVFKDLPLPFHDLAYDRAAELGVQNIREARQSVGGHVGSGLEMRLRGDADVPALTQLAAQLGDLAACDVVLTSLPDDEALAAAALRHLVLAPDELTGAIARLPHSFHTAHPQAAQNTGLLAPLSTLLSPDPDSASVVPR